MKHAIRCGIIRPVNSETREGEAPSDATEDITLETLFTPGELKRLLDQFTDAAGVASIIMRPDGTPLTRPSHYCRLCKDFIRKTKLGRANCKKITAIIGSSALNGPILQPCMSGALWEAGAAVWVGGKHVASWMIGQVRDETQSEAKMRAYARGIGADESAVVEAFREVPVMSCRQLEQIARILSVFANYHSAIAYQNLQKTRFFFRNKNTEAELTSYRIHLETLVKNRADTLFSKNKELQENTEERENLQAKLTYAMEAGPIASRGASPRGHSTFSEQFYKMLRMPLCGEDGSVLSSEDYTGRFAPLGEASPFMKGDRSSLDGSDSAFQHPYEYRIRYADGNSGHILVRPLPYKDSWGRLVRVCGIVEDAVGQKKGASERERLMSAMEQVGEMLTITDDKGAIVYVNPAFEQATGYRSDQVLGQTLAILESENPDEAFFLNAFEAVAQGKVWRNRAVHKRRDGTLFDVEASISPVRDGTGRIINYASIARDAADHLP